MGWGYRLRVVMWLHSVMYDVVGGGFGAWGAFFFFVFFLELCKCSATFGEK